MKLNRVCTPCILIGLSFILWTSIAMAQDGGVTITYEYVTKALFGALLLLVGAYARGVRDTLQSQLGEQKKRLDELDDTCQDLDLKLTKEYQTRADLREIIRSEIAPLTVEIRGLHERVNTIK